MTHTWHFGALSAPTRIRPAVRERIESAATPVWVSAVSVWEVAIKASLGKLPALSSDLIEALSRLDVDFLSVSAEDAALVYTLPFHHTDPFDRLLVAQAQRHGHTLVTADSRLLAYPIPILRP
ncbi:MAG: type II toxin-antitoxin system VapC family toxin [Bacteroidota bacterium]